MSRLVSSGLTMIGVLALCLSPVRAGQISITFDEKALAGDNNDPIQNFYNGGDTYLGKGPGPNLGVVFEDFNGRVFTTAQTGTYTPPGYMIVTNPNAGEGQVISTTMDVNGGFASSISFDYATISTAGSVLIYSGADGTGSVLADIALPVSSPSTGPGFFVADFASFSGIGHSIVFTGGNNQIAIDQIVLNTVPEPHAVLLLAVGMAGVFCSVWRSQSARRGARMP